jgi:hypothetical protein
MAQLAFVGVRCADRVIQAPRVFTMSVAGRQLPRRDTR